VLPRHLRCGEPLLVRMLVLQSPAFGNNPFLDKDDLTAKAQLSDIGSTNDRGKNSLFVIQLAGGASKAIDCSQEMQFRLMTYFRGGNAFTDRDDSPDSLDFYDGSYSDPSKRPLLRLYSEVDPTLSEQPSPSPSGEATPSSSASSSTSDSASSTPTATCGQRHCVGDSQPLVIYLRGIIISNCISNSICERGRWCAAPAT
jgi:hypothetical protein